MAETLLKVRRLSKKFGDNVVLQDVSFDLTEGEILGLMGPSGVGKSVLLKLIIGLTRADEGEIWFHGKDLMRQPERELSRIRTKIGYVFQNGALFDSLTVEENLSYPLQRHSSMSEEDIRWEVNRRLKIFGLDGKNALYPDEISGGMRKRAGMLRATMLSPRLVLFDEPTSGLDPINVENFILQIGKFRSQIGHGGIFVAHDPAAVMALCERVAILWEGRLRFVNVSEVAKSTDPLVKSFFRLQYSKEIHGQAS